MKPVESRAEGYWTPPGSNILPLLVRRFYLISANLSCLGSKCPGDFPEPRLDNNLTRSVEQKLTSTKQASLIPAFSCRSPITMFAGCSYGAVMGRDSHYRTPGSLKNWAVPTSATPFPGKRLIFHSQSKSDGKEAGAARRKYSYPMPAIPW